ncbi:MAG: ABC transporter permease [Ruminococcaceae bacterium]|nr:ABC transporter permease [Oscillospiraceae bacterium]
MTRRKDKKMDNLMNRTGKNRYRMKVGQNIIILFALALLVFVFFLLNPNFTDRYNLVSMAQSLSPYAILGLGVTFVIATGGIDLSIGTVCIAAAVVAGKMYTSGLLGNNLWLTIPIMIGIGINFGLLNGFLVAYLKLPAFIATLGTMMLSRGLSALIVADPNIFFPGGSWFNRVFSNNNGFPTGILWVIGFAFVCSYFMYKNKIGRYILSIGSNEEATRLSGINTQSYKLIAYAVSGLSAGIAAIFWAAAFPTVAAATGNGMELDAIAGVYIGGTSAAGGVASVSGTVIGAALLVVIRNGLNMILAKFNLNLNSTYVTYVLTGIIVVVAVMMDVIKTGKRSKLRIRKRDDKTGNDIRGNASRPSQKA